MRITPLSASVALMLSFFICRVPAQEPQVLRLEPAQIETLFIEKNLKLIAQELNICLAEAETAQAKLWDNPELSVESLNFWSSRKQREALNTGAFPQNVQFTVELRQLIRTAGKRSKQVSLAETSREIAVREFEDVLRALKVELRILIREIEFLQAYGQTLSVQQKSLEQLVATFEKQTERGNIARTELLRLQSGLLELENEMNETQADLNEQHKNLKSLLNMPPLITVEVTTDNEEMIFPDSLLLPALLESAAAKRPDILQGALQTKYHEKALRYEKAKRIPDITLSAEYDRYGGVWKNFTGIGIGFELPVLNRNKGNINAAKISLLQSRHLYEQMQNVAQHEVTEALANYRQAQAFYRKVAANKLLSQLDEMLDSYTKNLLNRNISMLEYIDFMESYRNNRQTLLAARKKMHISFSELEYATGSELR